MLTAAADLRPVRGDLHARRRPTTPAALRAKRVPRRPGRPRREPSAGGAGTRVSSRTTAHAEDFDFARADYRILIALREDYLAHLESVKGVMPSITQNRMRLARMTGAQALSAVVKPGGKLVSQEVAESIVRFVAGGSELHNAEIEPSLLSLVCRELNTVRQAQGRSEISADLLAGSRDTILSEFYERALADQPAGVRRVDRGRPADRVRLPRKPRRGAREQGALPPPAPRRTRSRSWSIGVCCASRSASTCAASS